MKYIKHLILIGTIMISLLPIKIMASEKITVYLFHGATCPHCQDGIEYLELLQKDYPNISIITYEVWEDTINAKLFENVKKTLESDSRGVPYFVIGNRYLTGFAEYRKEDIKGAIDYYLDNPNEYKDVVKDVLNNSSNNNLSNNKKNNNYNAVDISEEVNKKTYKEIIYLGIAVIGLVIIYIVIRIYEKRKIVG